MSTWARGLKSAMRSRAPQFPVFPRVPGGPGVTQTPAAGRVLAEWSQRSARFFGAFGEFRGLGRGKGRNPWCSRMKLGMGGGGGRTCDRLKSVYLESGLLVLLLSVLWIFFWSHHFKTEFGHPKKMFRDTFTIKFYGRPNMGPFLSLQIENQIGNAYKLRSFLFFDTV